MTLFKDVQHTCRFTEDWKNCGKCAVKNRNLHEKCRREVTDEMHSDRYIAFYQNFNPHPLDYREIEAQGENHLNVTPSFDKFVKKYWLAEHKLYNLPQKYKDEAAIIMKKEVLKGKTPCQAVISAFEVMREKYKFPDLYTGIPKW